METLAQIVHPAALAKMAIAVAFIQPSFDARSEFAGVVFPVHFTSRFWMSALPLNAKAFEKLQFLLRQGVWEAKCDKIRSSLLPPMRQSATVNRYRKIGMQRAEARRRIRAESQSRHVRLKIFGLLVAKGRAGVPVLRNHTRYPWLSPKNALLRTTAFTKSRSGYLCGDCSAMIALISAISATPGLRPVA